MKNIITLLDLISYACAIFSLTVSLINRKQIGLLLQRLITQEQKQIITPLSADLTQEINPQKPTVKKSKATKNKKKIGRPKKNK